MRNKLVKIKKIETHKFGPFYFSSQFNKRKIEISLIQAQALFHSVAQIPILPNFAARLEEELIRKSIFGTAAIEGNPLSESDVNKVLSQEKISNKNKQAEQQIINLKKVYELIKNFAFIPDKKFLITEKIIKSFQSIIIINSKGSTNISGQSGQYRNEKVQVGDSEHGGIYTPPKIYKDIKDLMFEFIDWINSENLLMEDPSVRAALAHYHLALIHPFRDGNGRTARAIEALLLKSAGIKLVPHMLSNFYYKNIDEYFLTFSRTERDKKHDVTNFLNFFFKGIISSLKELQNIIYSSIRQFTLKEFYNQLRQAKKITQRQFDFLILLSEFPEEFSLKNLFEKEKFKIVYRNVSERTARRDLKSLQKIHLISSTKKGTFELNHMVLG